MPEVSVIMPVYNGEKFLAEAIESVLSQSFQDFELICVNDGSTDGSQQIIDSFLDSRLKRLSQTNAGQASARNCGIKFCKGNLISFLDQDDVYLPTCIEERVKYFHKSDSYSFIYNDFMIIDENSTVVNPSVLKWRKTKYISGKCFNELFLNGTFIIPSSVMMEKEIFDKIGLFDETLWGADDYDLWLRISYYYSIGFVPSPLNKYRVHSQNFSKNNSIMENRTALAILKAVENFPDVDKLVGKREMKKRLYQVCFDTAYSNLKVGDLNPAYYWLKKAWHWGRKPKTLLILVATKYFGALVGKYYSRKASE